MFDHGQGTPMDWDELLFDVPVIGQDFEVLVRLGDLELFRGPMGCIQRRGDNACFCPAMVCVKRQSKPLEIIEAPEKELAPSVNLVGSQPVRLPDTSILIVASETSWFLIHAPGKNILSGGYPHDILV